MLLAVPARILNCVCFPVLRLSLIPSVVILSFSDITIAISFFFP